jgi:hypothetical protein
MDRRGDPKNLRYAEYATFSSSGGVRFGKDRRVATGLSNPNNDGNGGFFMGDYTGNAWAPDGKFYAAWMDTRSRGVCRTARGVGVGGHRSARARCRRLPETRNRPPANRASEGSFPSLAGARGPEGRLPWGSRSGVPGQNG